MPSVDYSWLVLVLKFSFLNCSSVEMSVDLSFQRLGANNSLDDHSDLSYRMQMQGPFQPSDVMTK